MPIFDRDLDPQFFDQNAALFGDMGRGWDGWISDTTGMLETLPESVASAEMLKQAVYGPLGAALNTAREVGAYSDVMSSIISLFDNCRSVVDNAISSVESFLRDAAAGLISSFSEIFGNTWAAISSAIDSLSSVSEAIPMVGSIIRTAISSFRIWGKLLRRIARGKEGRGSCESWNWAVEFAAEDSAIAKSYAESIGFNCTNLFLPPSNDAPAEVRRMNIANPKGNHYESWQSRTSFSYMPGLGARSCFSSGIPYIGQEPDGPGLARDRWESIMSMSASGIRRPWLPFDASLYPKKPARAVYRPGRHLQTTGSIPVNPFPKSTAICEGAFALCTGNYPQALMVDWDAVWSRWENFAFGGGYAEKTSDLSCEGFRAKGGLPWSYGGIRGYGDGLLVYEDSVVVGASLWNLVTGSAVTSSSDFTDWFLGFESSNPDIMRDSYGSLPFYGEPWNRPLRTNSQVWYIKYVCERLKQRQVALSQTDAAAYAKLPHVPSYLQKSIGGGRGKILSRGGVGIDLAMATAADPVFANAVRSKVKTTFVNPNVAPISIGGPNIYPPKDWQPPSDGARSRGGGSMMPLLLAGGAVLALGMMRKRR